MTDYKYLFERQSKWQRLLSHRLTFIAALTLSASGLLAIAWICYLLLISTAANMVGIAQ